MRKSAWHFFAVVARKGTLLFSRVVAAFFHELAEREREREQAAFNKWSGEEKRGEEEEEEKAGQDPSILKAHSPPNAQFTNKHTI